jgi:hypothetical protein
VQRLLAEWAKEGSARSRDGYEFIGKRVRRYETDISETGCCCGSRSA